MLTPYAQQLVSVPSTRQGATRQKRAPGHRLYSSSEWLKVRKDILIRDRFQCQLRLHCCVGKADRVDHKIPRSQGGSLLPDNLVAACGPCNSSKRDRFDSRRQITVDW